MKRILSIILAICIITAASAALSASADAAEMVVDNTTESRENRTHSSVIYLGEVDSGDSVIKYIYSADYANTQTVNDNFSAALGAMEDKSFSNLLAGYLSGSASVNGIKACSIKSLSSKMDGTWTSAKAVGEKYYPGAETLSESSGNVYDIDAGFKAECDRQEQERLGKIDNPIETGKRIISAIDTSSVDTVYYTIADGKIVKHVNTLVTYSVDAATVIYTRVKLEKVEPYKLGDADGDGSVTVLDATAVQRKVVGLPVPKFNEKAADVDGAGLDIADATFIQRAAAKIDVPYPIGETIGGFPGDEYELPIVGV